MKIIINILMILMFFSCEEKPTNTSSIDLEKEETKIDKVLKSKLKNKTTKLDEEYLISFLDSIGNLNEKDLYRKVALEMDSVNIENEDLQIDLTKEEYFRLKKACEEEEMDFEFAYQIFPELEIDSNLLDLEKLPIKYVSFDRKGENVKRYMISPGYTGLNWINELYFFESNRIVSKHKVFHKYGLKIDHFRQGENLYVYYNQNLGSGSGIWWFNTYFYKYGNKKLKCVLTEMSHSNLKYPWHMREFWMETKILTTNPLSIKFIYNHSMKMANQILKIENDSTIINYVFNEDQGEFIGDYDNSKLNKSKIYSYNLVYEELLFINAYFDELKEGLVNENDRQVVLDYLNEVSENMK